MEWITHTIWWHVYPLGFTGAPVRPDPNAELAITHRLARLTGWLDYAVELGTNGLSLGPIFASESHGYDTLDYLTIDPRLGDDADFDQLVADCRERGMHILLDGVFNHVGRNHPAFRAAMAGGPDAPGAQLFRINWTDRTAVNFEGHDSLVALNHENPRVEDLVVDAMLHWLRRGISGWRLDAAYAIDPAFWARVLPRVRAEFPDAWIVGEVIHGDYAGIVDASTMDSITQYELWKAIWSALKDGNFYELDHSLQRHAGLLEDFVPMTFVGNHDVSRIATILGEDLAALAHVVLFTVGGIPSVYYGDEHAYRGTKAERFGGDDEVRPPFPETPAELSELGEWTYRLHQDLISIRRRHPWLVTARTAAVSLENRSYTFDTLGGQGQSMRVDLRLDDAPHARITSDGEVLLDLRR